MSAITRISTDLGEPTDSYTVPEAKRLRGNPRQWLWVSHSNADGTFCAGTWRSEPGAWRVAYTEEEYCCILDGASTVTSASGESWRLTAGDEFVVPAGFVGTWEVEQTTTKRFFIHEPAPG